MINCHICGGSPGPYANGEHMVECQTCGDRVTKVWWNHRHLQLRAKHRIRLVNNLLRGGHGPGGVVNAADALLSKMFGEDYR